MEVWKDSRSARALDTPLYSSPSAPQLPAIRAAVAQPSWRSPSLPQLAAPSHLGRHRGPPPETLPSAKRRATMPSPKSRASVSLGHARARVPPPKDAKAEKDDTFSKLYAERADAFYEQAVRRSRPSPSVDGAKHLATTAVYTLRRVAQAAVGKRRSMWDHCFSTSGPERSAPERSARRGARADMQRRLGAATRRAIEERGGDSGSASSPPARPGEASAAKPTGVQGTGPRAPGPRGGEAAAERSPPVAKLSLCDEWTTVWEEGGKHASAAWGGLGYRYEADTERLEPGWDDEVESAAALFDARHFKSSSEAKRLLASGRAGRAGEYDDVVASALLAFNSNRFSLQPLRLDFNAHNCRANSSLGQAKNSFETPLALVARGGGGPLMPVHERVYADDVYSEASRPKPKWTLQGSIWGPRRESSPGHDYHDHEEVLFERFLTDWSLALRLGLAKMVTDHSSEPDAIEVSNAHMCTHTHAGRGRACSLHETSGAPSHGHPHTCRTWERCSLHKTSCTPSRGPSTPTPSFLRGTIWRQVSSGRRAGKPSSMRWACLRASAKRIRP